MYEGSDGEGSEQRIFARMREVKQVAVTRSDV